jgi:DNA-binding CsgD family transcriptional regulator
LLARLGSRLLVLTGGPRDLPARQRTMRDTIIWSHDLLSPEEQTLFRRLAVFVGGFALEAAESLGGDEECSVLDGVSVLVDHHLVQRRERADGEPRFGMLETIREYALERLVGSGDEAAARAAHAAWALDFAIRAEPELTGPEQARWLDRLDAEMANMRAALTWLPENGQAGSALLLATALAHFWEVRAHLTEGRRWLEELLTLTSDDPGTAILRARAYGWLGMLAYQQRDLERAVAYHEQSLALARTAGEKRAMAFALDSLGYHADRLGDRCRATTLIEEGLALYRELGDDRGIAKALDTLGVIAMLHGDREQATAFLEASLDRSRASGDQWLMAMTLTNLGVLANHRRDYALARGSFEESLALSRAIGSNWLIPFSLAYLGLIAQEQGDAALAAELFGESLSICRHRGAQLPAPRCLEGLAAVATTRGQLNQAALLFGAARAMREAIEAPMMPADRAIYDPIVATVRRMLGESDFAVAWQAGRELPVDVASDEAMIIAEEAAAAIEPCRARLAADSFGLTTREREVLHLLAGRATDKEIAEALSISPRTAGRHVTNILTKLGVHSRRAAAALAAERGIG